MLYVAAFLIFMASPIMLLVSSSVVMQPAVQLKKLNAFEKAMAGVFTYGVIMNVFLIIHFTE